MTVKSTDICGRKRWYGKLICVGLLKSVYRCYVPLWFQHNNGVSGGLPWHLKVAKTLELPATLPPGPPQGALPLDPTGALKRGPWTPRRETLEEEEEEEEEKKKKKKKEEEKKEKEEKEEEGE